MFVFSIKIDGFSYNNCIENSIFNNILMFFVSIRKYNTNFTSVLGSISPLKWKINVTILAIMFNVAKNAL